MSCKTKHPEFDPDEPIGYDGFGAPIYAQPSEGQE